MADKFNPAPIDKHAETPKMAVAEDKSKSSHDRALKDSSPASDPPSATQPAKPGLDTD